MYITLANYNENNNIFNVIEMKLIYFGFTQCDRDETYRGVKMDGSNSGSNWIFLL